jgi:hypothetical protein
MYMRRGTIHTLLVPEANNGIQLELFLTGS